MTNKTIRKQVGDHLALNYLNTITKVDGAIIDSFSAGINVRDWLIDNDLLATDQILDFDPEKLLDPARKLRDIIRQAVADKKDAKPINVSGLNKYLKYGASHLEVRTDQNGLSIAKVRELAKPEQVLAIVAEAAADLLVHGDFELVRHCESEDCVLWFYDRTKGHKRRWCSMEVCGNRHKVKAFRSKQKSSH